MRFLIATIFSSFLLIQIVPAQAASSPASQVFDIDANGKVEALSDGLLILRYLFDFKGDTLIDHAIGTGATRTTTSQIEDYLNTHREQLDIDGNGKIEALSDGLLMLRYLFDFQGDSLINHAIGTGATRTSATSIGYYIATGGIPDTERPAKTTLVSASSLDADTITLDWYAGTDNITPHSKLSYHLHISTSADFKPTVATDKKQIIGDISGEIEGLQADTLYYAMIVTIDQAGNQSWSNKLRVKTVATNLERTNNPIQIQTSSQNPVVEADSVTFKKGTQTPQVGSYISSSVDNGYLRKVTAVTSNNDDITVTTTSASLNEIFKEFEFSTTVRLKSLPAQAATNSILSKASLAKSGAITTSVRKTYWKKTGLTIIDPNTTINKSINFKTVQKRNITASANISTDGETQTNKNELMLLKGPAYLAADPGKQLVINVNAQAWDKPANSLGFGYKDIELCSIEFKGITLNGDELVVLPKPTVASTTINEHDGSLSVHWNVSENHVTEDENPYIATFTAYADEKGDGCNGADLAGTWQDQVTIKVPVYVTMGSPEQDDSKIINFSGDFDVQNKVDFKFDPDFIIGAKIKNATLQTAELLATANISLANTLTITANADASLNQTKTLVVPKQFIRVFLAGPVPIVVRGSFGMDIQLEANVHGAMKLEKQLQITIPNAEFGLKYNKVTGGWIPVTNFKQEYLFTIKGEADASADIKLTLIPDLQVHFYEAASGRMIVEPYLYGETGLHGQFKYENSNGEYLTDLDYWFTQLEAGAGIDLKLYAGLQIFDYNIASYPSDVSFDDTANYALFHPLAKTPIYGLPKLTATQDDSASKPDNSKAFLIKGTATNLPNPLFFGDSFNPFKKWTDPKVITNKTAYSIEPAEHDGEYWFSYTTPGTYEVRLSGYSELGWFVRQIAPITIELTDNDNDGLIDQWESQYGITDPNTDDDGDGLSNLEEYLTGKFPNHPDNDAILSAPQNIQAVAGDKQITLSWDAVTGATTYNICMATETITDSSNCATHQNGVLLIDKSIPTTVTNLSNDVPYYFVVIAKNASSEGATSIVISATPKTVIIPPATGKLNDTGITQCADNTSNNLACPVSTHPNQDAQTGRDATHNDDSDGHAGFSFTKISSTGAELPASATEWSCVKDNVTGLMWEVKTNDGGLHDKDNVYTWYTPDNSTNGGDAGTENGNNDTDSFVINTNAIGLCGTHDWRIPTREELRSIADRSTANPAIDTTYFLNTVSNWYWSSSPFAFNISSAWVIDFGYGIDYPGSKNYGYHIRLVHSGQ